MNNLNSLHVVITGASSGIGLALANNYFQKKCKISLCARNIEPLHTAFDDVTTVFIQSVNVSNDAECQLFIQNAIAKNGPIDILLNNAGISMRALVQDTEVNVLEQVMAVNFWGAVYCTKAALPSILHTKGVVCSISSIAGYRGLPARSGYSSSKFALQGFMESLRTELLHSGAHIMWVSPGFTASNIRNVAKNAKGEAQGETPLAEDQLMTAEQCANIIVNAIDKRKRTVVMTLQGKFTVWINKWLPSLADKLVFNHFAKEPNSPLANTKK